jgi:hypothetical protein
MQKSLISGSGEYARSAANFLFPGVTAESEPIKRGLPLHALNATMWSGYHLNNLTRLINLVMEDSNDDGI